MIEYVDVAEFHLRDDDRVDQLDTNVAAELCRFTVALHAAGDVSVDGYRREEAQ